MQVIHKYRILVGISVIIGQTFLFSIAFTAWKGLKDLPSTRGEQSVSEITICGNNISLNYNSDNLGEEDSGIREGDFRIMKEKVTSIDF